MRELRTIGVLGGMGPEAGVMFLQRLLMAVDAKDDADHIPVLLDQNTQVPSRIARLIEGHGADPGPVLVAMAKRLQGAGADALVMPCNTAHHYADQVRAAVEVPFINMVEMAMAEAARLAPDGTVGLLGSPALAKVGVFEPSAADHRVTPLHSDTPDRVLDVIRDIKSNGPSEHAAATLTQVVASMADQGANVICICCTEFSLLKNAISTQLPIFDALDLLVGAAVQFSGSGQPLDLHQTSGAVDTALATTM